LQRQTIKLGIGRSDFLSLLQKISQKLKADPGANKIKEISVDISSNKKIDESHERENSNDKLRSILIG